MPISSILETSSFAPREGVSVPEHGIRYLKIEKRQLDKVAGTP